MKKNNGTITLYAATQKVWGATHPRMHYFESIKERNEFVRDHDYADIAGTVKVTERQFQQWKDCGAWTEDGCF